MLPSSHLVADSSKMSDAERDQIDLEAKEFIMLCSEKIKKLQQECEMEGLEGRGDGGVCCVLCVELFTSVVGCRRGFGGREGWRSN